MLRQAGGATGTPVAYRPQNKNARAGSSTVSCTSRRPVGVPRLRWRNADRNAWESAPGGRGSCGILRGRQLEVRSCTCPQCAWQGSSGRHVVGQPVLVKRQDDAGPPDGGVPMQRAELTIGVLTWILLLQLHEHGLDRPLRLRLEPAANLIPD